MTWLPVLCLQPGAPQDSSERQLYGMSLEAWAQAALRRHMRMPQPSKHLPRAQRRHMLSMLAASVQLLGAAQAGGISMGQSMREAALHAQAAAAAARRGARLSAGSRRHSMLPQAAYGPMSAARPPALQQQQQHLHDHPPLPAKPAAHGSHADSEVQAEEQPSEEEQALEEERSSEDEQAARHRAKRARIDHTEAVTAAAKAAMVQVGTRQRRRTAAHGQALAQEVHAANAASLQQQPMQHAAQADEGEVHPGFGDLLNFVQALLFISRLGLPLDKGGLSRPPPDKGR